MLRLKLIHVNKRGHKSQAAEWISGSSNKLLPVLLLPRHRKSRDPHVALLTYKLEPVYHNVIATDIFMKILSRYLRNLET